MQGNKCVTSSTVSFFQAVRKDGPVINVFPDGCHGEDMPDGTRSGLVTGSPAIKACSFFLFALSFILECSLMSIVRNNHFFLFHH